MTTLEILSLLNLPSYGVSTVRKIVDSIGGKRVNSPKDLLELVNDFEATRKRPAFRTLEDIKRTLMIAGGLLLSSEAVGIRAVSYVDDGFPKNLSSAIDTRCKPDIPLVIFYKGDLSVLQRKSIAIIGTREPTSEGREAALHFGQLFAEAGYNVLSGLSQGCESYAHEGALKAKEGRTTALLSHGLDFTNSLESANLAEKIIAKGGLLISKYPIEDRGSRCSLLSTNRLQAVFADAILVIQSRMKGATFHAAREALNAKKPVFCVNFIEFDCGANDERVRGNALLVSQGAVYLEKDHIPL